MEIQEVRRSYARWARFYDSTFGAVTQVGRRAGVAELDRLGGRILEVGVGTGLALPFYKGNVEVTGIDASAEMLAKASARVKRFGLTRVRDLRLMDARELEFPDASFDGVAAMHLMSVVPEPGRVMAEMARVLRPGGTLVIVNHFARDHGALSVIERLSAPFSNVLGWHSDFDKSNVLGTPGLRPESERQLPPLGMMTLLTMRREGST